MSKKTTKTKDEPVLAGELTPEEKEVKAVAEAVSNLLVEKGFGLQPFLSFTEFGVTPNVRLVKTEAEDGKS